MNRFLTIMRALVRFNLQQDLAYRSEAAIGIGMGIFWMLYELGAVSIIFNNTQEIGGWRIGEVIALTGVWKFMNTLMFFLIWPNTEKFNDGIRNGTLDYVFVQPINSQLIVSLNRFVMWRLTEIVFAVVMLLIGLSLSASLTTPLSIVAFIVLTTSGAVILYSIWIVLIALTFWFTKFDNNVTILQSMMTAGRFPSTVYPAWLRVLVTFIIPIGVATTVPLQALRGDIGLLQSLGFVLLSAVIFVLSAQVWKAGVKRYSGASA